MMGRERRTIREVLEGCDHESNGYSSASGGEEEADEEEAGEEEEERLEETLNRRSSSGTPFSGSSSGMSELHDELQCRTPFLRTPFNLRTPSEHVLAKGVLAVYRSNNDMKGELESLKAELKTLEERLDKGIGDALADERLKTLEEVVVDIIATADIAMAVDERLMILEEEIKRCNDNVSSLESKLNPIRAFGLAVIVLGLASIVLFLIQAYWTFLTHGIDTLVSLAGICIDFVASAAAPFKEFLVSKAANAVTSAAEVSGSKIGIRIVQSEM